MTSHASARALAACALATLAFASAGCGTSTPQTGGCRFNADCGGGLVCVSGACVQAPKQSSCAPGQLACNSDEQCPGTACVDGCCAPGCKSDTQCNGGVCLGGVCRPREDGRCSTHAECAGKAATPVCDPVTRACVACLADNQCPRDQACGTDKQCHPLAGCTSDEQCRSMTMTPRCLATTRECVACLVDSHCSTDGTWICNTTNHTCQMKPNGCTNDAQCASMAAAPHCLAGRCVACSSDSHCSDDGSKVCNLQTYLCRTCREDADCARSPAGSRCRASDRRCVRCLQDSHCQPGERCLADNTCGTYTTCNSSRDCTGTKDICDATTRQCVECVDSGDCLPLFICVNYRCFYEG